MSELPPGRRVLVSGASVAGPALALWLQRYGFEVTVVEKADGVRPGGQPVDFKGATHLTVLRRMGVLEDLERLQVGASDGTIVDAAGRTIGRVPGEFSGGDLNVPRGDLARLLHERTASTCTYRFGDSITSLTETADGVEATFERGPAEVFDLVVGADGMHSRVRALAFGPEEDYVSHLGYYYAQVTLPSERDEMYNEPGRMAATSGGDDPAFFVWASERVDVGRDDVEAQKQQLADAYRGSGWRVPELLAAVPDADDFWLDSISRATVDRWSRGRVVLLGDAAWGCALGGFGTGLAVVGAYVLAGELACAGGDHRAALADYERRMRGYAKVAKAVNAGRLLAPTTRRGIWLRNKLFSVAALFAPLMRLGDRFATDIDLPDYTGFRLPPQAKAS